MPATIKNRNQGNVIVSSHVKDYSRETFFVKKTEDAKVTLEKFGFPDQNLKK